MKYLSYIFYLIAILAALSAGFQILNQMFPDYGIFHLIVGFIGTAMFFPLVPIYPAINNGEWIYLITCYFSILLGVILNNRSRTTK
tara:strand:- start:246 stop:503 length:258 start_codon:yes stop_codon:yes gene_type:complete